MTFLEETKLEAVYNGGFERHYGHSKYRGYDESELDYERDEHRRESSSVSQFLASSRVHIY